MVDLGCGSGLWARELTKAGYCVLGLDISEEMIEIARKRVPEAEFRVGSLFAADLPPCDAVTSMGEVLNYLFDSDNDRDRQGLARLFHNIYDALHPGGMFIFDVAETGQVAQESSTREFTEGEGWVVLVEKREDSKRETLTRRIISFREVGEGYRRDDEVHHLQLYSVEDLVGDLRQAGFRVRTGHSYREYRLPRAHAAFFAHKPA